MRDLGGDRRLAGAGRAADEHDQRQVERLQTSASRRKRSTARAPSSAPSISRRERFEPVEVDGALAAFRQVDLEPARELVRTVGRHADRDQRARHQPLRIRQPSSPSGSGYACLGCVTPLTFAGTSCEHRRVEIAVARDHVVAGEHDAHAVRERVLGDDVDRRAFQLDEVRVGVDPSRSRASAARSASAAEMRDDVRVEVRSYRPALR